MPAGSPEVTAMTARGSQLLFEAVLDVGAVAHLAQPVLVGLVRLALAQGLARSSALAIRRDVLDAPLEHLDQVPAERRAAPAG